MYNKKKSYKFNDKKILHKVKKQWVVISLALLMLMGGNFLILHDNIYASNNSSTENINQNKNIVTKNKSIENDIPNEANSLHKRLLQNLPIMTRTRNSLSDIHNNSVQDNVHPNNNYWIYNNGSYISSDDINWINKNDNSVSNLRYKYDPIHKAVEVTNYNPVTYAYFPQIPDIKNALSIKFNNTIDMSNVKDYNWTFANLNNIKSLDLGNNFNTINATNMGNMFNADTQLQYLNLGDSFTTANVQHMTDMFAHTPSLKYLNLGEHFDTSKVKDMGSMFSDTGLQTINLPSSFNTQNVVIANDMFRMDYNLEDVSLPTSFNMNSSYTQMTGMFYGDNIHYLTIHGPKNKWSNDVGISYNFYRKNLNGGYSSIPHEFSHNNIGTFVDANVKNNINPITNPNQYLANDDDRLIDPKWNQNFHFNNPQGQNNDIESIIPHFKNNKIDYWNVYYLWNPDTGSSVPFTYDEWGQINTKNFSSFESVDKNDPVSLKTVAIPNPQYEVNGKKRAEVVSSDTDPISWNQVAGGSVISNRKSGGGQWLTKDTFGHFISPNARLAYFANFNAKDLGSYLAYANPDGNGGYKQFHPYSINTVFNGNMVGVGLKGDFRDPYVTVNPKNPNQLVAYLAGSGIKVVYALTSQDAIHWHLANIIHLSRFITGSCETPYVTEINNTPILFCSAQNGATNEHEENAYVTGQYNDDGIFQPNESSRSGSIDQGIDIYAGNFSPIDNNHLIFIGWLNNWGYFNGDHNGGFTLPRVISWQNNDIKIAPINPGQLIGSDKIATTSDQYQPKGEINIDFNSPVNSFDVKLTRINDINNYINLVFNNGTLNIKRNGSVNGAINVSRNTSVDTKQLSNIHLYLDNKSIEAYIPETHQIFSILDYDNIRNTPYKLSVTPSQNNVTSYQFNLSEAPQLDSINNIVSEYSAEQSDFNNDMNILNIHSNDSINNSKSLLNSYFTDIQNDINNANNNITQVNSYNGDARQHVFIALANNDMDMANTKLYQASLQLKKLDNMTMPYLGASVADARITNYYKNSISNSVALANQSKANSAASSADASIENSIANSYAQFANRSIASSYSNSVAKSVSSVNQSKADSAASSADASIKSSIANSYAQSADQNIAKSEASKSANHQTPTPSPQPSIPTIPINNVIPTVPTSQISNEPSMVSNSTNAISSSAPEMNSFASSASNINSRMNYDRFKITIPLVGLAKHARFFSYRNKRFIFTNQMKKHADVLQATVRPNHKVTYKVRVGKRTGYLYGYLRKLFKPTFMNKRLGYFHDGKHTIKLSAKRFNRIKVNRAVRYAGKNYVKYYVSYRHKHGVIYGALPKVAKVNPKKNVYKKYYQVIPRRYHYVKVIKPLIIYDNKRFTRRTHRGSMRKGVTVRVKRLVKNGGITRFKLMNGRYITGLKKYVKFIK